MLLSPLDGLHTTRKNRVSTVLQNEASECGLACLAMIVSSSGQETSLSQLRRRFTVSSRGMTLRSMISIADALGLTARPIRLELEEIADLNTPSILHWGLNHFVVLEKVKGQKLLIHDPARGRLWIEHGVADRYFTGVAIEFTATPSFLKVKRADTVHLKDLFPRVRGVVPAVAQMFLLAAIMQAFSLVSPILNQLIVDEAISKGNLDLLTVLAGAIVFLLITTSSLKLLQGMIGVYIGTQMSFQMRSNLLRHTLRLPVSWFEKRHVGDVLSRFSSLQPIQDTLLNAVPSTILNGVIGIVAFGMMVTYSPLLAGLELTSVFVAALFQAVTFPVFKRYTLEGMHLDAKVQTTFLETIRGARTFKLFANEHERVAIWQNQQARLVDNQIRMSRFRLFSATGSSLLGGGQQVITWFIGAKLVINGDLTLGMLFAFQMYTSQFGSAASSLIGQVVSFRTLRVHLERLGDIVKADVEPGLDIFSQRQDHLRGEIELKDVTFAYADHEPNVVNNVSLKINEGDFVCFQGPSGQGKTTLLKLMLGFNEPQSGNILIDGVALRTFGINSYRSQIGAVLQDDQLFGGSISDNISFFDLDANMEDVKAAARAASIHDDIMTFPMKYETYTGDLGSSLSGGQRQRVLLARALYRKPKILFLDEGTANLDPASEQAVMDTVRSLSITRVVVAHRPHASNGANRIYFVEGSKIVEK